MATGPDLHREERLDQTVAAFLEAQERGELPDPRAWVEQHPDIGEELDAFFADQLQFDSILSPLRPPPADGHPTVATAHNRTEGLRFSLPAPGERFGDYQLLEEIARGGMGVVYKARHAALHRTVAIKMLLAGRLASQQDAYRFQREAEGAALLDHPNIVPIYEVGELDGRPYFTMKYVEGGNLTKHVQRLAKDHRAAARLLLGIARAVDHAHQRGLLHRDLKPANILLDGPDTPLVTDFGLAKIVQRGEWARQPADGAAATETGTTLGTPSYMAPEQAFNAKSVTTAADVYSLGAILYELLTGQPPFRGDSPFATLMAAVEREPVPPRAKNPRVPRDLETICLKCLHKVPAQRYANAAALADDLQRFLNGEVIAARPAGRLERMSKWVRRHPALTGMAAVLALVLVVAGTVLHGEMQNTHEQFLRAEENYLEAQKNLEEASRQAEQAKKNFAEAEKQRQAALDNEKQARRILNTYYTLVREKLPKYPGTEPLRREMLQDGLKYYQQFLADRRDDPLLQREVADAYDNVGWINSVVGSRAEALKAHEKALELYQKALAADPTDVKLLSRLAMNWHNVGWLRKSTQQLATALEAYEKARQIYEQLLARPGADAKELAELKDHFAGTLNNIGALHNAAGRLEVAQTNYDRAHHLREEIDRAFPDDLQAKAGLAQSYHNRAILAEHLGKRDESLQMFEKERDLRDQLARRQPRNADYQNGLASAWFSIGVSQGRRGNKTASRKAHERALEIRKKVATENVHVIGYQIALASSYSDLGGAAQADNHPKEALIAHTEARDILERALRVEPDYANLRGDLAKAHFSVAYSLTKVARHKEALPSYEKARAIQQQLVDADPGYLEFRHDFQLTLNNLALLYSDFKEFDKARALGLESVKQQKVLYQKGPGSDPARHTLAMRYSSLSLIERRAGRLDEAAAWQVERKKYCKGNLTDMSHVVLDLGRIAQMVGEGKSELSDAEREQRQRIATTALDVLRELLAAGYRDFQGLETRRELAAVRELPEFQEILRPYKK
jgi:tetratricopeptide (TPR) repeat protein/tRNA A-37 threonylcarbamoyl transferase component Bud32